MTNPLYQHRACDVGVEGQLGFADSQNAGGSLLQERDLRSWDETEDRQRVLTRRFLCTQAEHFRTVTTLEFSDRTDAHRQV